mgnify:CR=1 FL=1
MGRGKIKDKLMRVNDHVVENKGSNVPVSAVFEGEKDFLDRAKELATLVVKYAWLYDDVMLVMDFDMALSVNFYDEVNMESWRLRVYVVRVYREWVDNGKNYVHAVMRFNNMVRGREVYRSAKVVALVRNKWRDKSIDFLLNDVDGDDVEFFMKVAYDILRVGKNDVIDMAKAFSDIFANYVYRYSSKGMNLSLYDSGGDNPNGYFTMIYYG